VSRIDETSNLVVGESRNKGKEAVEKKCGASCSLLLCLLWQWCREGFEGSKSKFEEKKYTHREL